MNITEAYPILLDVAGTLSVFLNNGWQSLSISVDPPPLLQTVNYFIDLAEVTTTPSNLRIFGQSIEYMAEQGVSVFTTSLNSVNATQPMDGSSIVYAYVQMSPKMIKRRTRFLSVQELIGQWAAFFSALLAARIVLVSFHAKKSFFAANPGWDKVTPYFQPQVEPAPQDPLRTGELEPLVQKT